MSLRKIFTSSIFFAFIFSSVFLVDPFVSAETICSNKDECSEKIKEYEEKLDHTREEKTNLQSQLILINTKVELARVRIQNTQHSIEETQQEISELGGKIEKLNSSLDRLTNVLLQKIVQGYKNKDVGFFDVFLSDTSATLSNQLKYIQVAQENDRMLALRTQQVKVNFSEQKNLREEKKQELEELEKQVIIQKAELDSQVSQKEALLVQTKSDEKKYQQLLSQALAEFEAVNRAIETGQKVGKVKKGDPIALVGNTGYPSCSTGAHLHFEVRKDGQWVNPGDYIGEGKEWQHPLTDPVILTQNFGTTPYSWRYQYSGGIHTGYDMVSKSSDVIRAVADGTLYASTQACGSSTIKIKYIEHSDSLMSFYLHVQ